MLGEKYLLGQVGRLYIRGLFKKRGWDIGINSLIRWIVYPIIDFLHLHTIVSSIILLGDLLKFYHAYVISFFHLSE
jgi:hypothetical protein